MGTSESLPQGSRTSAGMLEGSDSEADPLALEVGWTPRRGREVTCGV